MVITANLITHVLYAPSLTFSFPPLLSPSEPGSYIIDFSCVTSPYVSGLGNQPFQGQVSTTILSQLTSRGY